MLRRIEAEASVASAVAKATIPQSRALIASLISNNAVPNAGRANIAKRIARPATTLW